MTIKQFAEKYGVEYNDVHTGLRKYAKIPTTFEKNIQYDECVLISATRDYLRARLAHIYDKKRDLEWKLSKFDNII